MTINRDLPLVAPYVDVEQDVDGNLVVTQTDLPRGSGFENGARVRVLPVRTPAGPPAGPQVHLVDEVAARTLTGLPVGSVGTLTRYQVLTDTSGALLEHGRER